LIFRFLGGPLDRTANRYNMSKNYTLFLRTVPLTVIIKQKQYIKGTYTNFYLVPFAAFNEQLAILQRTAINALILWRGARTTEGYRLIDSGMPPVGVLLAWPQACIGSMRNWLQRKLNHTLF
jgi:hypothetical protein